ncbi:dienelactone hydrolase family protein [Chitinophaga polysaccharea]|uniref:dienelactone hydrolase family protein n=1 Tax=Chitinophaga polysaccharea TaxID=1293035 RepID=UPI0011589C5B|nr:acyl-CoA thioester hydrolase/BAAT C-terminal domain-containing protein [Chitinophaga polysaccharea]
MKSLFWILIILPVVLQAQTMDEKLYGYRHFQFLYKGDTVNMLVKSKEGEERKRKPVLLFCQGSLPVPLMILYNEGGRKEVGNVFVFNSDLLTEKYHLAIIGKPGIPLQADRQVLSDNFTFKDSTGYFPRFYTAHNLLDYYVERNKEVIRFLRQQSWVSEEGLVIAGHSEGSTIAAKVAVETKAVSALIYSGGNPMGRIMTIIERNRALEKDSTDLTTGDMNYWQEVVNDPGGMDASNGDTHKATYQFSIPPLQYLEKLKIPVLVSYGSKDAVAPFDEYLRVEMIRQKKQNFSFLVYPGTEHNYFPVKADGTIDYDIFNWDKVAGDWKNWLLQLKKSK